MKKIVSYIHLSSACLLRQAVLEDSLFFNSEGQVAMNSNAIDSIEICPAQFGEDLLTLDIPFKEETVFC